MEGGLAVEHRNVEASTSCPRGPDQQLGPGVTVGYVFTEKKKRSLLSPDFLTAAKSRGLHFVPVDPKLNIHEQEGHPFDLILHKLPSSAPNILDWERKLKEYTRLNPRVTIVDTPEAARVLSNRATMLRAVEGIDMGDLTGVAVAVPRQILVEGTIEEVCEAVQRSGLQFPLLAKPLLADGSETSHALALVYDTDGLVQLARGDLAAISPPCVVQEFVDHGGFIFKVYVVGDVTTTSRRRSLPDLHKNAGMWRGELHGLEFVERISCIGPSKRDSLGPSSYGSVGSSLEGLEEEVEEPSWPFVRALARALKNALGLELFNFDLIRKAGERNRFLVVDINYFPGIAKMPDYETVFADFLWYSVERKRSRLRMSASGDDNDGDAGEGGSGAHQDGETGRGYGKLGTSFDDSSTIPTGAGVSMDS